MSFLASLTVINIALLDCLFDSIVNIYIFLLVIKKHKLIEKSLSMHFLGCARIEVLVWEAGVAKYPLIILVFDRFLSGRIKIGFCLSRLILALLVCWCSWKSVQCE